MPKRSSLWFYIPPPLIVSALIGFWQYRKHQPPATAEEAAPDPVEEVSPRDKPTHLPPAHSAPDALGPRPTGDAASLSPAALAPARTLAEANALFAELAGQVLPADRISDWLRQTDLPARIVATVDSLANGASPRDHIDFLASPVPFGANQGGNGQWYAAAANALRTKAMVETFCLADATTIAAAYARLEPVFDQLYRDLGYPDARFRDALARACQVLLDTPVPDEPPSLVRLGTVYRFADPALERLKPAQKHLIRLGIDDAQRVQLKIRQLAQALRLATPP